MADIEYTVGVETQRANANLKKLQGNIKSTSSSFDGLRSAIASIAIGALVRNSLLLADAMVNMARATGISVANITAFSQAMATSGGTADRARDAISDLTKNLGAAAAGSSELQSAFGQVGVSLNDLATLSSEDIFRSAVEGLTEIPDMATRSSVAMRLFGESVKGVDLDALSSSFDQNQASASEHAGAIESAAAAQTSLTESMNNFKIALISAIEPLTKIVSAVTISVEAFSSLIKILGALGGAFLIFRKVLPAIQGATNGFYGLAAAAGGPALKQIQALGGHLKRTGTHLKNVATGAGSAGSRIASMGLAFSQVLKFAFRFAGIVGIIYSVVEAANALIRAFTGFDVVAETVKKLGDAWEWVKNKIGFVTEATQDAADATKSVEDAQAGVNRELETSAENIRAVVDASEKLIRATVATADGYRAANAELIAGLEQERDRIGLAAEHVRYLDTIGNFNKQHATQIAALNQKLSDQEVLTEAGRNNYAAIKEQIALLTSEYQEQLPIVTALAAEIRAKTVAAEAAAEAARLETERVKELADAVSKASESAQDFATKMAQSTEDAQNDLAMLNMDNLEKELFKIKTGLSRDIAGEVAKLQQLINKTGDPDGAIQGQINAITQAGQDAIAAQSELATRSYEYQRSWSYGWSKAFRDYKDDATNAAKSAERVFSKATKGMEDSIVGFVKTGKFEWRDFVSSILEELLRAQVQQLIAQIFGSASPSNLYGGGNTGGGNSGSGSGNTLGNIISSIGNIFGGSNKSGGTPPILPPQQSSSGGLGNIISSIGSMFSGGLGSIGTGISNAVSGVSKFFSGFFANGGMIPAGGYGIVGEAGPEFVSGPARVTPMGATTVNYNINAVDAQSFAALVARDPGLIYAVTEQGRRNLATRR